MKIKRKSSAIAAVSALLILSGCKSKTQTRNRMDEKNFPSIILWAWERPEELRSIDPNRFAVAFLAQTLVLKGDEVILKPRHQPLDVSPETRLIAVTRIESQKTTGQRAALSDSQKQKIVGLVAKTLELRNISAIQIDFDAAVSEREFYRAFLQDLRQKLPDNVPLSMTALASFCVGDQWLRNLPVDEAVPMIFRMGADDQTIRDLLAGGEDFGEPLCRRSYGLAIDEPLDAKLDASRRRYVFNSRSWTQADVAALEGELSK
jgi:hypothetical protein